MWGATWPDDGRAAATRYFNPRSPCGERLDGANQIIALYKISIHAPRVGSDISLRRSQWKLAISIHAPRVGSDPSGRCRHSPSPISIHAPRVGSDNVDGAGLAGNNYFNPRSPCGERLTKKEVGVIFRNISIHAPRVGSDWPGWCGTGAEKVFQSTLPVWGATGGNRMNGISLYISIHAPRVGSDHLLHSKRRDKHDFNPRSPCGERPGSPPVTNKFSTKFQSTLPVWGATGRCGI